MSLVNSAGLQAAILGTLLADTALQSSVGTQIFDEPATGSLPTIHIVIGDGRVQPFADATHVGAVHDISISVRTTAPGFAAVKSVAAEVCAALEGFAPMLGAGSVVNFDLKSARATRSAGAIKRRVDLRFRAVTEDS